jgi:hypothetical protein
MLCVFTSILFLTMTAWGANPVSPVVVKEISLTNQTANIATTTLFTPVEDGLFRISYYLEAPAEGPSTYATINTQIFWSDDFNPNANIYLASLILNESSATYSPGIFVLRVKAGTPITFQTTAPTPNCFPTCEYSLFMTVERLSSPK